MTHELTEQRFLRDVAEHQMTVIRDQGLHRHIRFAKPGTYCMHFDLITWPGYLCYTGDMGTFVFRRLEDMFAFFRTDREYQHNKGRALAINPGYWGEKLEALDRNDGFEEFDEERFRSAVLSHLVEWIRSHRSRTTREERRELWDAVMMDVIDADGDNGGHRKQIAAHDFTHQVNREVGQFYFRDFWEHRLTKYSHRFMWCCYALAWGIERYDATKAEERAAA